MTSAVRAFLPREQDIVNACLGLLRLRGVFAYRQNQGAFHPKDRHGERFIKFTSINGVSDIIGVLPGGKFLAVECKRPGKLPTDDQQEFLDAVRRRGGLAVLIYDVRDLDDVIARELGTILDAADKTESMN